MPLASANLTEMTFELADREIQCFYEELQKDAKCNFVFQVVAGGHYDVDCFIEDPRRRMIYRKHKIRQDSLAVKVELSGVYSFCFGNQFSTFSHKKIYFHLEVGEEIPIFATAEGKDSALTQLEASCLSIHTALRSVMNMQTQQRVQALIDHLHAEDMNSHIIYWASSETIILFLVTVGQVIILKRFFTDKRANVTGSLYLGLQPFNVGSEQTSNRKLFGSQICSDIQLDHV
ncbi:transmembrane emp24 domain-containing protein 3-like [Hemiscyllium ocellatum]|uniref:transmembrane emp24 domain-containing protein 3-like n=1 Tax=Hemiscyllium ocellatum TaxID=170820 RepID=UPI0029676DA4|nr:transmembrane emp24 domain-containing protein 3-like [Hemiscyllium ocellatum]